MTFTSLDITQLTPEQRALLELRLKQRDGDSTAGRISRRADRRSPFPLSFPQQGLWLAYQLRSADSADIIAGSLRLRGQLDRGAFERSLNEIVQRHEVLRTRIMIIQDQPVQCVDPFEPLNLNFIDLRDRPAAERDASVRRLAAEDARRPFNLGRDCLFRVQLIRVADDEHILLLAMHHIVSDGWSLGILFGELSVLYSGYLSGGDSQLPELTIQYGDFAAWQKERLRGKVLESRISYWKEHLDRLPLLALPFDHPRPAVQTFRGGRALIAVPKPVADGLKSLSEQDGASLFMTMMSAFKILLSRYANQYDFAVGTSVAGRYRVDIEDLIGCFLNLLAIRTNLAGDPDFREVLRRVRESTLNAYDHQDLPFEKLVEALQPARTAAHTPLFQVTFELHHRRGKGVGFQGLEVEWPELAERNNIAKYDLSISMSETEDGLNGFVLYNADLFDATTIDRMMGHFQVLLSGIVANPDQPISQLPLLTGDELHWCVTEANATQEEVPVAYFHRMFEAQMERTPDATALKQDNRRMTYRELNERANQLANFLRSSGIGLESLVGVFMHRSPEMMVALLGVLKSGGAYVPLDPTYPLERLQFMAADAGVKIVLTEKRLAGTLAISGITEITLESSWDSLIAPLPAENHSVPLHPLNLAYVIYTSGSTGRPKGVMITHLGITNYVRWAADAYRAANGRGALVHSPIGFDMTLTGLFPPLVVGKSVELLSEAPGVERLKEKLLEEKGFSLIKITPAHLELLNRQLPPEALQGRTGTLVVGADALSAEALSLWRAQVDGTNIINEYGPTETVVGCAIYTISDGTTRSGPVPIGVPISNMQMYVLDQNLGPAPIGVEGELYIGGFGVARGYLNRPDLTAERFVPDPFSREPNSRLYRTGDACHYLAERRDHIEFRGRLDYQVKLRGFRIELGEIEAALLRHPAVREAVVVEQKAQADDKRLIAYLVTHVGHPAGTGEIREFLKKQLPEYMVPAGFVVLPALPLTPNGKVDRRALPAAVLEQGKGEQKTISARDPIEEKLVELWEAVLDVRPISIKDNFFEIGGHSLLAERLTAHIRREFDKTIKLSTFFEKPTVEQIAALLREGDVHWSDSPLVALKPDGTRPPFFCVHSLSGEVAIYSNLARSMPADQPFYAFRTAHPSEVGDEAQSIRSMASTYVELMVSVQPHGPYHLGGYSFGCVIAFEMAQQLRAQGRQVGLLVLVDGISPFALHQIGERGDAVTFAGIVRDWARMEKVELALPHELIRSLSPEKGLEYILAQVKSANLLKANQDIGWVRRFLNGIKARSQAIRDYSPTQYDGTITLFRSTEVEQESAKALIEAGVDVLDPKRGWDKLSTKPLDTHFISGHHATLLQMPHVERLAQELVTCMDAASPVPQV